MDGWNTSFVLGWPSFRCYVSFTQCKLSVNLPASLPVHWAVSDMTSIINPVKRTVASVGCVVIVVLNAFCSRWEKGAFFLVLETKEVMHELT